MIKIEGKIEQGPWVTANAIYPLKSQIIHLQVKKIKKAHIRWYQIMPDTSKMYKNANHPWEENPYKWIGFEKIDYKRIELKSHRNQWIIQPKFYSRFFNSIPFYNNKVGSFWIQAIVTKNGKAVSTPGIESADHRGLSPKVFRISVRDGKGYLGYLTSFLNVPGLFGSVPHQSYHYIGADCADILIAAHARWKKSGMPRNYNVAMLVNKFKKVARFKLNDGNPDKTIKWGKDVLPGDFIAVRYNGQRQFQHIGSLYKDDGNGTLDNNDIVIHAGPDPLHFSKLKEGIFDGHVIILRP